jgi:uncharacterized protein (TIGR04255 family)
MTIANPLIDPAPTEVPLSRAPLAKVLYVVNFPAILKINDASGSGIAPFQEAIRREYPVLSQGVEHAFTFQAGDEKGGFVPQVTANTVWQFADTGQNWRATMSRDSLALETQGEYTSRSEFVERFQALAEAFCAALEPAQCVRIGTRYVNVIADKMLRRLAQYVRPEVGAFGHQPFLEALAIGNQAAEFQVPEGRLIVRAGILKPGQTHDPQVLQPEQNSRYFLDLDAINLESRQFLGREISSVAAQLAARAYTMFRWAVTEKLLEACDG